MNKLRMIKLGVALVACTSYLTACGYGSGSSSVTKLLSSYSGEKPNNLRISLTDAPNQELKNVFINVDHAELFVRNGDIEKRVVVAQDLGMVDLLTLRNGVLLPMHDLSVPNGVQVTAIRLVLKGENNHSIKSDDSRCEMQTPSGQQSGIKIHLAEPFTIGEGYTYSMVMDFDAAKSVVIKGNGDCLLKPVLKLLNVTRKTAEVPVDPAQEEPITSGEDDNSSTSDTDATTGDSTGFEDPVTAPSEPELITPDELYMLDF